MAHPYSPEIYDKDVDGVTPTSGHLGDYVSKLGLGQNWPLLSKLIASLHILVSKTDCEDKDIDVAGELKSLFDPATPTENLITMAISRAGLHSAKFRSIHTTDRYKLFQGGTKKHDRIVLFKNGINLYFSSNKPQYPFHPAVYEKYVSSGGVIGNDYLKDDEDLDADLTKLAKRFAAVLCKLDNEPGATQIFANVVRYASRVESAKEVEKDIPKVVVNPPITAAALAAGATRTDVDPAAPAPAAPPVATRTPTPDEDADADAAAGGGGRRVGGGLDGGKRKRKSSKKSSKRKSRKSSKRKSRKSSKGRKQRRFRR